MDRRLSGALAWGALLLIVGIPGIDMLSRSGNEIVGAATTPSADGKDTSTWQSSPADRTTSSFGPLPDAANADNADTTDAGEDDSLPDVTLLAKAPAAVSETPPAAPSPSIITLDAASEPAAPAKIDSLDVGSVIAQVKSDVAANPLASKPEPTSTESPDTASAVIAARVRDVLFSSPDATPAQDAASDTGVAPTETNTAGASDDLSAVATAPLDFSTPTATVPETIPYPAPAIRRVPQPVAETRFVPPEPVPEVRPDNAIFFNNWVGTPPTTAATGPGR